MSLFLFGHTEATLFPSNIYTLYIFFLSLSSYRQPRHPHVPKTYHTCNRYVFKIRSRINDASSIYGMVNISQVLC